MKHLILCSVIVFFATPTVTQAQPGYRWTVNTQGEAATLLYGTAEPEDPHISLSCRPGSRDVRFYFHLENRPAGGAASGRAPVAVTGGGALTAVRAQATPEEMYGGVELTGALPAASAALSGFRRTGRIRFQAFGQSRSPSSAPLARVRAFLRVCGV